MSRRLGARHPVRHHDRPLAAPGDDAGVVGGTEVLPFGLLIFVCGSLLFVNAWGVVDTRFAVASAAREATRAYAESTDPGVGRQAAHDAAGEAIAAYGHDPEGLALEGPSGALVRCGTVTSTATYQVPAIRIPVIGGFGDGITVSATHTARVDELAAGLPEGSQC